MLLEQKLAARAAAAALLPVMAERNAACAAFAPGDTSDAALTAFCAAVDAVREHYHAANGFSMDRGTVTFTRGAKNARIVLKDSQTSVHCFVDLANGNILKSASWAKPANGVRGNIINGAAQVGPHGAAYLR
jgi:hypothetical protein